MKTLRQLWLWSPASRKTAAGDPVEASPLRRVEALALVALIIGLWLLDGGAP